MNLTASDAPSPLDSPVARFRDGTLGIIAGSGLYPFELVESARAAGVRRFVVAAFQGETNPDLARHVEQIEWMRVGQLGRLLKFLSAHQVSHAMMAGQIAPDNLFNLRPDVKALLLLAKLKERNAESIFGAIADEFSAKGIELILATTFMDKHLAQLGHFAGPKPSRKEERDVEFGYRIGKEISRLDIGQMVVVKGGTVLAVEGFDGTNATITRGGSLGKKNAVVVKVSKPHQDLRFDVPVIGPTTLEVAAAAKISVIAVEAGRTLVLDRERVNHMASELKISLVGVKHHETD